MKLNMKIKAIGFDAYGTIFDTGTGSIDATRRILSKNGTDLDPENIYAEWKRIHQQIIASLLSEFEKEEEIFRKSLSQIYAKYHLSGCIDEDIDIMLTTLGKRKVFPDALACLDQLRGKYQVIIASNSDTQPLRKDIHRNQIFYDWLVTSERLRIYKPRPEFYLEMLKVGPFMPHEVIYVGDSILQDYRGPQSIGIKSIWLNRKGECFSDVKIPQIASLIELAAILEKWVT
jgi:2-haloalkanoic acid dehalogenase type II